MSIPLSLFQLEEVTVGVCYEEHVVVPYRGGSDLQPIRATPTQGGDQVFDRHTYMRGRALRAMIRQDDGFQEPTIRAEHHDLSGAIHEEESARCLGGEGERAEMVHAQAIPQNAICRFS